MEKFTMQYLFSESPGNCLDRLTFRLLKFCRNYRTWVHVILFKLNRKIMFFKYYLPMELCLFATDKQLYPHVVEYALVKVEYVCSYLLLYHHNCQRKNNPQNWRFRNFNLRNYRVLSTCFSKLRYAAKFNIIWHN